MGLAGEKEIRILPAEIECPDIVLPPQFMKQVCVELGDSSAVRVETGQQCDSQTLFAFAFLLDVCGIEAFEKVVGDVKMLLSGDYRH